MRMLLVLVGVVALGAAAWWLLVPRDVATETVVELPSVLVPAPPPAAPVVPVPPPAGSAAAPAVPVPVVVAPPPLPQLDASDDWAEEQLAVLGLPAALMPRAADGGAEQDLVRRFATILAAAAEARIARRELAWLRADGAFPVVEAGGRWQLDPAGFRRYDAFVTALDSVDPDTAAAVLARARPLVRLALADLGDPDAEPVALAIAVCDRVLAAPVIDGPIVLERPNVLWRYADPQIEAQPAVVRQLIRMGPVHTRRVQAWIGALRSALLREQAERGLVDG